MKLRRSVFCVVAACLAVSLAVTCYNCGGNDGSDCGDTFKTGATIDCGSSVSTCTKVKGGAGGANYGMLSSGILYCVVYCIPYRMKIYMEFNLATGLRLFKFTELNISKF